MVRQGDLTGGSPSALDAPLANPDRLWPSGLVEYKFYDTFPVDKREIMQNAMEYITRKVSCIKFREATDLTKEMQPGCAGANWEGLGENRSLN